MGSTSDLESEELERLRAGLQMMALRALGDPEAAEEVAQETLTRVVRAVRAGRVKWGECLGGFVRGIARHVIADVFRARKRSTGLEAVAERANAAQPDDPLTILILAEEQQRVGRALSQLAEGDREILHLSFFAGLTPAEIAERLDEPVSRIRKRKSRALERLRRAFHGDAGAGHDPG
ncbi:MAG: sigma-70 family RNA polymerase sigma factor [Gemmatimonadota bacterium]|nr:MAG: sigma-70 family RNA polymerase sigma factor [Gemmatimonadota bacterium]